MAVRDQHGGDGLSSDGHRRRSKDDGQEVSSASKTETELREALLREKVRAMRRSGQGVSGE
ncbi:MAG: hypothetical protein M1817_004968 [Caeruleum heppii]|nr:MAG: hypothetical protein M1817_004968 [Caeruleum heppii]